MVFLIVEIGKESYTRDLDIEKNLSNIRNSIGSIMGRQDSFIYMGGILGRPEEESVLLKDALIDIQEAESDSNGNRKLKVLKINKKVSVERKPLEAPEPEKIDLSGKRQEFDTSTYQDMVEAPRNTTSRTAVLANYFDLTGEDRKILEENNQLRRGLIPTDGFFERSMYEPVENASFIAVISERSIRQFSFSTYRRELHQGIQITSNKASASAISPFVSASVNYESSQLESEREDTESLYLYAACKVPKISFKLDQDAISLSKEFQEQVSRAVKSNDYWSLCNRLGKFGYFFPLDITLGGSLSTTDVKDKSSVTNEREEEQSLSVALATSISAYSANAGYANASSHQETTQQVNQQRNVTVIATGGDPATTANQSDFVSSLGHPSTWRIIEFNKVVPVIQLLSPELAGRCARLIVGNGNPKIRGMDSKAYIGGIIGQSADEID